jgi:hypothetical protein
MASALYQPCFSAFLFPFGRPVMVPRASGSARGDWLWLMSPTMALSALTVTCLNQLMGASCYNRNQQGISGRINKGARLTIRLPTRRRSMRSISAQIRSYVLLHIRNGRTGTGSITGREPPSRSRRR